MLNEFRLQLKTALTEARLSIVSAIDSQAEHLIDIDDVAELIEINLSLVATMARQYKADDLVEGAQIAQKRILAVLEQTNDPTEVLGILHHHMDTLEQSLSRGHANG